MAAFRLAVEQGYDIIEFDPKYTKDDVCVILHDRTLNRTGRIAGEAFGDEPVQITDKTFSELGLLEKFAARFPKAPLHYDGPVSKEALEGLERFSDGHKTVVWMRLDIKATSWNRRH